MAKTIQMGKRYFIWFLFFLSMLIIIPFFWSTNNKLIKKEENIMMAWAQVENQYQRRSDLILNLAETVKGYSTHEQDAFGQIIEARANATKTNINIDKLNTEGLQEYDVKQSELTHAFARLIMVVESYPDLKANENFIMQQGQIEGTENRISFERKRFNESVKGYNTYRRRFPRNIAALILDFRKYDYFEAIPESDTKPNVNFNKQ